MANIGLFTYLAASLSFALLAALLVMHWRVKPLGPSLFVACSVTAVWAAATALSTVSALASLALLQLIELVRNASWLFFLLQLLGLQSHGTPWLIRARRWRRIFFPALTIVLALVLLRPLLPPQLASGAGYDELIAALWLIQAVLGLLMIEQLFRNATAAERWSIKYLCLGLGVVFSYDFFMYSETLLFRQMDSALWQARGLVSAVVTPLLAVAIGRNSNWRVNLHVSRHVIFHTVTLMGAGLYLLGMALTGYLIKYLGGSWGSVLQMSFLAAAAALLLSLLFSGKLRAQLRVLLSKHFFSYRYDYREEWLKFTQALAGLNDNVGEGIIRIMATLVGSPAGLLWTAVEGQPMRLLANWQMPPPEQAGEGLGTLPLWLANSDWVIDLHEWRRTPDLYAALNLPQWLQRHDPLWLIVPLTFRDRVEGVLMLKKALLKQSINWEDRDLLKTAGRQAATHLAQYLASKALIEARQFDAFNRLSAFVVHDLKNILAQQALLVSNAARHRNNPVFIDDMISTVDNSVARMRRLMEQMRSGVRSGPAGTVQLADLLTDIIHIRASCLPLPSADFCTGDCAVNADRERLATVFSHLIQNAQEASDPGGTLTIKLSRNGHMATVVITDSGCGMDETFIRERLFHPFESTKGLTGMGIGTFESRDYIRQLGGDIHVVSRPAEGSTFTVTIPACSVPLASISAVGTPIARATMDSKAWGSKA